MVICKSYPGTGCTQAHPGKHVVFGRVIRGYEEVVKKLAQVPVDDKDRPLSPIVISNCGELELRGPGPWSCTSLCSLEFPLSDFTAWTAKPTQPPESMSEKTGRRRSRRSRSRSRSSGSEDENRRRKKSKRKRAVEDLKGEKGNEKEPSGMPIEETEEEYDARLEREEKERIEAERRKELERIKRKYENDVHDSNGIRFKGL